MKKFIALIAMFALVGTTFVSCNKDEEESLPNYITINGDIVVNETLTYFSPTFNLGDPDDHFGQYEYSLSSDNSILIGFKNGNFSIGDGYLLEYNLRLFPDQKSASLGQISIEIYKEGESGIGLGSQEIEVKIISIGEVGEYIEGTYQGVIYPKKSDGYSVQGRFKVKHINNPNIAK